MFYIRIVIYTFDGASFDIAFVFEDLEQWIEIRYGLLVNPANDFEIGNGFFISALGEKPAWRFG